MRWGGSREGNLDVEEVIKDRAFLGGLAPWVAGAYKVDKDDA